MKSIELFAGIGGIALAAEWAGVETVAFCEREPFCQKVLNKNFPGVPIFDDVCTLNRQLLEEKGVIEPGGTIDIISGGFPCQPYSIAGKRRGTEDDRDLWPEMFRIIKELRPTWVVGENVANFANMELDRTLSDLESAGYTGQSFIIPACAVDAKHRRDRTFVVAYSGSFGRMERKGQPEKIQQSGKEQLQREKSSESFLSKSLYGGDQAFSDTYSERLQRKGTEQQTAGFTGEGEAIPDTSCERCDQVEQHDRGRKTSEKAVCQVGEYSLKPRGEASRWTAEPDVGRVAYGVPDRVDRIKGLGNAVVPQQIYPIFRFLREFHS
ncbi:DNA (cytosine-5-)-methyltransferase [Bacillus velezensis]|uniref:DNA cytosine methyltransferase n=1 Tax=Bacillus velezensis TaxID=492670 RepID=UPI0007D0564A|nr:DNA (cytosine-5-)-methyltransferase [Bacillus velezensis]OAL91121.1 DNA methyltransferase [Bacillus velezensis]